MKKFVKYVFLTLGIAISIIIVDSVQAMYFNNSPFLKIREDYNGGDLYCVDRGILVDTYYGTNGKKDTVIKGFSYSLTDDTEHLYKEFSIFVNENETELEKVAESYLKGENTKYPNKIKSVAFYEGENSIVEFSIGSKFKQYCGFYYSEDDVPVSFQNAPIELRQLETDEWEWNAEGDNKGKTIKIKDNWYYYEATF